MASSLSSSDARRRSTMVQNTAQLDAHGNMLRTGIPLPVIPGSTIKKPAPPVKRMSLAGPALRGPYPQAPALGAGIQASSNPRQSIMMRSQHQQQQQNSNPLLQSAAKPGYGRTPLNSSTRWTGHSTLSVPSNNNTHGQSTSSNKDPRPLRERPYQTKMRQEILSLLQSTEYDLSMQTLLNITGKDFRSIVYHLVHMLDPNYHFDPAARFEEEFVPALRALHYPYANQIDVKWLAAPASMHSWPFLLGALHWLAEMCRARAEYLGSSHPTLQNPQDVPDEFSDPHHHQALIFDYYDKAYGLWLDGEDVFTEASQALEERYAKTNEQVQADLESQRDLLNQARAECKKLESSAAPLEKLLKENGLLKTDNEKFQKILKQYEGRKKKLIDTISHEKNELASRSLHLEQLQSDQDKLSEIVKTQNLSPEEVIRMNTDHETLSRNLEDLKQKISETHKIVMSLEVSVTNRAAAAEEALDAYTGLLSSVGLFPPLPPPLQDVDLTMELNTASANPATLLTGADIRKVVKPVLSRQAESKRAERAEVESERIRVDNELDQLTLECENVEEETGQSEKKVAALNEQADDLRDTAQQEAIVSNSEATRLERELALAKNAALANGMGVKARLQALQFDYREQEEKVNRLRDDTVRAIIKNSNDIAMFKEEVSRHLRDLREFAEME